VGLSVAAVAVVCADGLLPALTPAQAREAQKLVSGFKKHPKGPYLRIRWYCNDGSVHPPQGLPCKPLGGGRQHAEISPQAARLAQWNLDLGTILAPLAFHEFFDLRRDHHRLKQLVLEQYLVEADQGWIYRGARTYRGARQAEDEEKAGRKLLIEMLADPAWTARHYYLANQAVAAVPHGAPHTTAQKIRALAKSVADQDRRFQPIRNQIHSSPGPNDLPAVENYLKAKDPQGAARTQLEELAGMLRREQQERGLQAQIGAFEKKLAATAAEARLAELAGALGKRDAEAAFRIAGTLSMEIRRMVAASADGRRNLDLLDLNALLVEFGFRAPAGGQGTRRQRLALLVDHLRFAAGAGLLSPREFEALRREAEGLPPEVDAEAYYQAVKYLARGTEWCRATVAKDFGPVARLYEPVEPAAGGLVDHLLRGSMALPLSAALDPLVADANQAVGIRHQVFGQSSSRGIVGLNPGVAVGRLGFLDAGREDAPVDPDRIYVIPETLADLKPMAGILTFDSGNALSHAQLLAANLGIPNASAPSALLPVLRKYKDKEIVYAVTPRGTVILREAGGLTSEEQKIWLDQPATSRPRVDLDTSRLNLSERRVLSLRDLGVKDAGVLVGPKAANLAQLMSYFPDRVAPALALPFGIFHQHLRSKPGLQQEVQQALAEAEKMRRAFASASEVRNFIYPRLARIREAIRATPLDPGVERSLAARMQEMFGPEGSYGVFVRSDTNAEDLPGFTGAGLNLTVPNQVGTGNIMQALRDVWASPFTERAYDWRAKILRSQENVAASVIVMRSVPSDKSGVIGTINLETGAAGEITVNVSEGVMAVVDGGVAESLLLRPNGEVRLLQQSRSPYRKVLVPAGGVENRPTSSEDFVLTADEIAQIRRMVADVDARYPKAHNEAGRPLPWDIEFGFEKGQLRLFQIRPLVRSREERTLEALSRLEPQPAARRVRLEDHL